MTLGNQELESPKLLPVHLPAYKFHKKSLYSLIIDLSGTRRGNIEMCVLNGMLK